MLEQGYVPGELMDGANIWRIHAGDRLAWCGGSRPGYSRTPDGILGLFDFHENVLCLGEQNPPRPLALFGSLTSHDLTSPQLSLSMAGMAALDALGAPRYFAPEWRLG